MTAADQPPKTATPSPITGQPMAPSIHDLLGIEMVEVSPERVVLRLEVDWRSHQPAGLLHGGVSALLAEAAASIGAAMNAPDRQVAGVELNASHLRPMSSGTLTATATPVRVGRTLSVWQVDLADEEGRAICAARCSVAVRDPPAGSDPH